MACSTVYAEAWEFAAFWCQGSLGEGTHEGAGPADASLQDSHASFLQLGIEANVGTLVYNVTQGTSGPITAVTANTITATGVTWANSDVYRVVPLTAVEKSMIDHFLEITAADISIALRAQDACDCTFTAEATAYIKKLNIIEAATFHICSCASIKMDDSLRTMYFEWASEQLKLLRQGKLVVCEGDTGDDYPTIGWAPIAQTEIQAKEIIIDELLEDVL